MVTRLPCLVPFCRRTRGDRKNDPLRPGLEWICAEHWRLVDRSLKLKRRRLRRRHGDSPCGRRLDHWIWKRMKAQAIERAGGIN